MLVFADGECVYVCACRRGGDMTPSKLTAVFGQHHTRIFKVTLFILDFPFLHFSSCTWVRVTVPALNEHVKLNDGGMG